MRQQKFTAKSALWLTIAGGIVFIAGCLANTGCVAEGDWKYTLTTPVGDWSIAGDATPPKPEDKATVLTFDNWFKKWWEALTEIWTADPPPPPAAATTTITAPPKKPE